MRDKMAISAYIFEKSGKGPIFKAFLKAEENFNQIYHLAFLIQFLEQLLKFLVNFTLLE